MEKQATVALSSWKAEYMGLGATTQEALYLMQLIKKGSNVLPLWQITKVQLP